MRTVRSFANEPREASQYSKAIHASYEQGAKRALAYGLFIGIISLVSQCAILLVLWYGGTLVLRDHGVKGGFDAGKLMSFLLYTVTMAGANIGSALAACSYPYCLLHAADRGS